jgi:hypothetical protein
MFYFLVPTAQATMPDGSTVTGPKYLSTVLNGLTFTAIPFGAEGLDLLSLAASNAALAAEPDVFAFPTDLTAKLLDADVTNLTNYLSPLNVPTSQLAAGQTWVAVLRQLAQVFLAAQYAAAQNGGQSLFTVTVSLKGGKPTPSAALVTTTPGTFDFTKVDQTQTVADTLLEVAAQFTAPIKTLNGGSL